MKKEAISAVREAVTHELKCHHSSRAEEGKLTEDEIKRMADLIFDQWKPDLPEGWSQSTGLMYDNETAKVVLRYLSENDYLATKEEPAT